MSEEFSRLLNKGAESIVQRWTEKVVADRRVRSDARLTYLQLVDHIPQMMDEIKVAIFRDTDSLATPEQGEKHGRVRWQQGYELKEVVRELMLLRATLLEFFEEYVGALHNKQATHLMQTQRRINGYMDEELYHTIEAYLESEEHARSEGVYA